MDAIKIRPQTGFYEAIAYHKLCGIIKFIVSLLINFLFLQIYSVHLYKYQLYQAAYQLHHFIGQDFARVFFERVFPYHHRDKVSCIADAAAAGLRL